jgi:cell division septal protein FtsQ
VLLTAGLAVRRIVATGYFQVESISVHGAGLVDPEAVAEASGVRGKQLWQVDTAAAAAAARTTPGIKDATATRAWPDHVRITVQERLPAAVWRSSGTELVVDDEGVVLNASPMGGLPAINQTDGAPPAVGQRVDADAVRLAIALAGALPDAVGQHAARFEYSAAGLDVVTDRGLRVRFGDGQNLSYKLDLWRGVLAQARADKTTPIELDLRFGQWAALR